MRAKAHVGNALRAIAKPLGYSIVGGSRGWIPVLVDPLLKPAGVQMVPSDKVGRTYIDCKPTLAKAREAGVTVPEYVARLWNETGVIEAFTEYLRGIVPIEDCSSILEIGAGTGRFLDPIKRLARPQRYTVYETSLDWTEYLVETYGVTGEPANGVALERTPDASQKLVHAHQVFVYLPVITSFGYFHEMCRVCAPDGYVVFDCYLDVHTDLATIEAWRKSVSNYQMILPRSAIVDLFRSHGFELLASDYRMKAYVGHTSYLIFRKP
jgi:SAM-dependent methyltransferase